MVGSVAGIVAGQVAIAQGWMPSFLSTRAALALSVMGAFVLVLRDPHGRRRVGAQGGGRVRDPRQRGPVPLARPALDRHHARHRRRSAASRTRARRSGRCWASSRPPPIGRDVTDFMHPDDVERVVIQLGSLVRAHVVADGVELRLGNVDGTWRTVEAVLTDLRAPPVGRRLRGQPARHHRAQGGRGPARAPRRARSAHRPRQPHADPRPGRADARAVPADAGAGRGAVHRPRQLQGGQRHARPRGRRPAAAGDRGTVRRRPCGRATRSVGSAATSSWCSPRGCRSRPVPSCSPSGSATCCASRSCSTVSTARCRSPPASASPRAIARPGEDLLRDADIALYRAKAMGKDCAALFAPEMQSAVIDRLGLKMDLQTALANGEFRLLYQPLFDLDTMHVYGVEALLRWHHPVRGVVGPNEFIPMLEETGLITDVGRWVLREACGPGRRVARGSATALTMSVNVSMRQLDTPGARRSRPRGARPQRARAGRPAARDHRDRAGPRHRRRDRAPHRAQAARRVDRDRRLRHRLLVARLPPAVPGRRAEDRPLVHRRHGGLAGVDGADPHDGGARARARARHRRRRDRGELAAGGAARAGLPARPGLPRVPPGRRRRRSSSSSTARPTAPAVSSAASRTRSSG